MKRKRFTEEQIIAVLFDQGWNGVKARHRPVVSLQESRPTNVLVFARGSFSRFS